MRSLGIYGAETQFFVNIIIHVYIIKVKKYKEILWKEKALLSIM
jgi:hypothetical protein